MKNAVVVGVDPGKSGFICLLGLGNVEHIAPEFYPMPVVQPVNGKCQYDTAGLVRLFRSFTGMFDVRLAVIESQQAYPGQGGTSNFSTGYGYGLLMGVAAAVGLAVDSPHPRTWQKDLCRDLPGDPKMKSILASGRLFPTVDLRRTERCKGPDDNKSDSLLIAEWGRRKVQNMGMLG